MTGSSRTGNPLLLLSGTQTTHLFARSDRVRQTSIGLLMAIYAVYSVSGAALFFNDAGASWAWAWLPGLLIATGVIAFDRFVVTDVRAKRDGVLTEDVRTEERPVQRVPAAAYALRVGIALLLVVAITLPVEAELNRSSIQRQLAQEDSTADGKTAMADPAYAIQQAAQVNADKAKSTAEALTDKIKGDDRVLNGPSLRDCPENMVRTCNAKAKAYRADETKRKAALGQVGETGSVQDNVVVAQKALDTANINYAEVVRVLRENPSGGVNAKIVTGLRQSFSNGYGIVIFVVFTGVFLLLDLGALLLKRSGHDSNYERSIARSIRASERADLGFSLEREARWRAAHPALLPRRLRMVPGEPQLSMGETPTADRAGGATPPAPPSSHPADALVDGTERFRPHVRRFTVGGSEGADHRVANAAPGEDVTVEWMDGVGWTVRPARDDGGAAGG